MSLGMKNTNSTFSSLGWYPWAPVFLFASYWTVALVCYHIGPIVYPVFYLKTYIFIGFSLGLFFAGYKLGLGFVFARTPEEISELSGNFRSAITFLKITTISSLIGIAGLVVDRFISGAASIDKTLNNVDVVRDDLILTPLTTISNLFYLPVLISLALFMYCLKVRWKVPLWVHASVCITALMACFLAFLGAERQAFLFVAEYIFFYLFFLKNERLSTLIYDRTYRAWRIAFLAFLTIASIYIFFIARYRSTDGYLDHLTRNRWAQLDRYHLLADNTWFNERQMGSVFLLASYMTDELEIADKYCKASSPFCFNPGLLFGDRVWFQVKRFDPEYVCDAYGIIDELDSELSDGSWSDKWKGIFGCNLVMFGCVGGILFMGILGIVFGFMVRQFLLYYDAWCLIIVLCLYLCLTMSYMGFYADIFHLAGLAVGLMHYLFAPKSLRPDRRQRKRVRDTAVGLA